MSLLRRIYDRLYTFVVMRNEYILDEFVKHAAPPMPFPQRMWRLLRLNFHYRILRNPCDRPLYGPYDAAKNSGELHLPYLKGAESELGQRRSTYFFAKDLLKYDVVSFDIFDTLILRPVAKPADLFMIMGGRLDCPEFYRIRTEAEKQVREEAQILKGNHEVTIHDIWARIEERTGIPREKGIQVELETEVQYCFANPYMKQVFRLLRDQGKTIIIVSDMYFPHDMMEQILRKAGYTGYDKLYVSCDYNCSKRSKALYEYVKRDYAGKTIVHVGDNATSDIKSAREAGLEAKYYKNVHELGNPYRADGMSPLIGSVYAGLVNTHLHNGTKTYSPYYEYGYTYGGLYVFGFCNWIYRKAKQEGIDKILFLSRDGAIYQKVFNMLFDDMPNDYFLWSRIANLKYTCRKNREDFIKRAVIHRSANVIKLTMKSLLETLDLECLLPKLKDHALTENTLVLPEQTKKIESFFIANWDTVCHAYDDEKEVLKQYILQKTDGAKRVAFIDVGWMGSGALGLKYLIEQELKLNCKVSCWQAAVKQRDQHDIQCEMLDGTISSYIFSQMQNRSCFDVHKKTNSDLNCIFFELFTQDTTPSYGGITKSGNFKYDIPETENYEIVKTIHEGIYDFCCNYKKTVSQDPYLFNISGYDAYMPYRFIIRDITFITNYFSQLRYARGISGDRQTQSIEALGEIIGQAMGGLKK